MSSYALLMAPTIILRSRSCASCISAAAKSETAGSVVGIGIVRKCSRSFSWDSTTISGVTLMADLPSGSAEPPVKIKEGPQMTGCVGNSSARRAPAAAQAPGSPACPLAASGTSGQSTGGIP